MSHDAIPSHRCAEHAVVSRRDLLRASVASLPMFALADLLKADASPAARATSAFGGGAGRTLHGLTQRAITS